MEPINHRNWIFSPENKAIDNIRMKRYFAYLVYAHRIPNVHKPFAYPCYFIISYHEGTTLRILSYQPIISFVCPTNF